MQVCIQGAPCSKQMLPACRVEMNCYLLIELVECIFFLLRFTYLSVLHVCLINGTPKFAESITSSVAMLTSKRRKHLATCSALTFILYLLLYTRTSSLIFREVPSATSEWPDEPVPEGPVSEETQDIACRIWPDWSPPTPVYAGVELPQRALVGDAASIGQPDRCVLPDTRLSPYSPSPERNWSEIQWGQVQRHCASITYGAPSAHAQNLRDVWQQPPSPLNPTKETDGYSPPKLTTRSAIVMRTWSGYNYTEDRLSWLRALIAETALHSHGEYEVFFLVDIKDRDVMLEEDESAYKSLLEHVIPREFQDLALLYNERTLKKWYPKVEEHGAQHQMYQALQIFSEQFPQFDFVWQLEMDLRVTGHLHEVLSSAAHFARTQPRRNLWSRNGRFYIPEMFNSSYQKFVESVDDEMGNTGIWGPVYTSDFVPKGPTIPSRLDVMWGVGEHADLISFMPMIDPEGTNWIYEERVYGFADGVSTPRRAAFVSMTSASRFLLHQVHEAQRRRGQWLVSEATMETFALLHGLKAVTIPHPVSFDSDMTPKELDTAINRGPTSSQAGGKNPSLAYTKDGFIDGPWATSSYWWSGNAAPDLWHAYLQGECLPPMLLHPVKD